MALVTGTGEQARDETAFWHEAMDAYRKAFPLRPGMDRMKWWDASQEYGLRCVTRFRGWRDLHDERSPYYAENQAHLAQRERILQAH